MSCLSFRGAFGSDEANGCTLEPIDAGPLLLRALFSGTINLSFNRMANLEVMDCFELWFVLGLNVHSS